MSSRFLAVCCVLILSCAAFAAEPPKASDSTDPGNLTVCGDKLVPKCSIQFPIHAPHGFTPGATVEFGGKTYPVIYVKRANIPTAMAKFGYTCLAMRNYVFRRENKDSDAMQMTDVRTCTPASAFRLEPAQ